MVDALSVDQFSPACRSSCQKRRTWSIWLSALSGEARLTHAGAALESRYLCEPCEPVDVMDSAAPQKICLGVGSSECHARCSSLAFSQEVACATQNQVY